MRNYCVTLLITKTDGVAATGYIHQCGSGEADSLFLFRIPLCSEPKALGIRSGRPGWVDVCVDSLVQREANIQYT